MTITPQERRSYNIAIVSIFVSLVLLIFSIASHTQRNFAIQQAATAQAERSFAAEQVATAQTNVEEAKNQAAIAHANELAAYALAMRSENFQQSMLLGIEAYRISENYHTKSVLFDNARTNPQVQSYLSGHTSEVRAAAFSSDGNTLATGGFDGIILWDVKTGQIVRKVEWKSDADFVTSLTFSRDGDILASINNYMRIELWNVSTGKLLDKQPLVTGVINTSFSPDGNTLALGICSSHSIFSPCVVDKTILWSITTGQIIETIEFGAPAISFGPDGNILVLTGKEQNSVVLWDIKNHQVTKELFTEYPLNKKNLIFFTNGNLLAGDRIWDINTGQPISQSLHVTNENVFSPDGTREFSVYRGDIFQSDIKTGEESLFARLSDQYGMEILAVNPDGNTLAVWGKDRKSVMLVNKFDFYQPVGRLLASIDNPNMRLNQVAFSPDGKTLTAADFPSIMQWNVKSGELIGPALPQFNFPPSDERTIYSPDGVIKASIDAKNDVIILSDVKLGIKIRTLDREGAHLWENITFSPNGKILTSIGYTELVLWDVESGQSIGEPLTLTGKTLAFSPDGNTLATVNWGRVILWDINPQSWIEQTCKRVGRNLTILEWEKYFPGEQYHATCSQWLPAR